MGLVNLMVLTHSSPKPLVSSERRKACQFRMPTQDRIWWPALSGRICSQKLRGAKIILLKGASRYQSGGISFDHNDFTINQDIRILVLSALHGIQSHIYRGTIR